MQIEKPACALRVQTITEADLPLACPLPVEAVWNAHPRVYLPISRETDALCPYCGTQYRLV